MMTSCLKLIGKVTIQKKEI